jgi:putative ABC transport system substrate-binding protein
VAAGLATSLSRPSANVTGVVSDLGLVGTKRLELMREVRPGANHIAALTLPQYWDLFSGRGQRMYQEHGVRLTCLCVANPVQESAYRQVFANLGHDRPDFIYVLVAGENFTYRELIVGLANEMRVPAMYPARQFVELGGLMSYAWDSDELFRYAARQMAAILRGQPVSEIPFYMPIKWELAINLRTAKGIGLEIPPSILARADSVIE